MRNCTALMLLILAIIGCAPSESKTAANGMSISSPAFANDGTIPAKYTCDGANVSPPLAFGGVPASAQWLSLTLRDPDAPGGNFIHWVVNGIPPKTAGLAEGAQPLGEQEPNGFGKSSYGGPCPPRGQNHRYIFTLVARRGQEIIAKATLTGRFGH